MVGAAAVGAFAGQLRVSVHPRRPHGDARPVCESGWPVFRFVGIVCAAATVLWVVVGVAFFVAYLVRVRVLARRFWAARCRRRVSAQRLCCGPTWPVLRLAGPW